MRDPEAIHERQVGEPAPASLPAYRACRCDRRGPLHPCVSARHLAQDRRTDGRQGTTARRPGGGEARVLSRPFLQPGACGGLPLVRMPADVRYGPGRNGSVPTASGRTGNRPVSVQGDPVRDGRETVRSRVTGVDRPWITRFFPGAGRSRCGVSASPPRMRAVWAGRRLLQAPPRLRRSACGSDGTGSLCSRTTAVLRDRKSVV